MTRANSFRVLDALEDKTSWYGYKKHLGGLTARVDEFMLSRRTLVDTGGPCLAPPEAVAWRISLLQVSNPNIYISRHMPPEHKPPSWCLKAVFYAEGIGLTFAQVAWE